MNRLVIAGLIIVALCASPVSAQPVTVKPPKPPAAKKPAPPPLLSRFRWVATLDEAKTIAREVDAPIILYIYAANSPACADFEQKVFSDSSFRKLAGLFVLTRMDIAQNKTLADLYQVKRTPTLVFLDSGGERLYVIDNVAVKQVLNHMGRSYLTSMYRSARRARQAGDIRIAIRRFRTLLVIGEGTPPAAWAQRDLDSLGAEALKKYSQAQIAFDGKDLLKGMSLLDEVVYQYRGTEAGLDAKEMLQKLVEDAKSAGALREVERRRDGLRQLALAKKFEEKKDLESALITYWDVERDYAVTPAAEQASARAAELAKDKDLADKAARTRIERDGKRWFEMAESFAQNKMKSKAVEYYRRIITCYPDSEWAKKAQREIGSIAER